MAKKRLIPEKYFTSQDEFQKFLETEKRWMYTNIVEAIKYAIDNNYAQANIMEVRIENDMSMISVNSDMDEWNKSLTIAMEWYASEEEYEICADIKSLIDKL